jgi:hypothetical protein
MREADREPPGQGRQRAVVIAAAIAQPVAAPVERQQRHEQDIRFQDRAVRPPGAEPVLEHDAVRLPVAENQRLAARRGVRQRDPVAGRVQRV